MATIIQASANGVFSSSLTWVNGVVPNNNLYIADANRFKVNIDSNVNADTLTLTNSGGFVLSSGNVFINSNISAYNLRYPVLSIQGNSTIANISGTIYGGFSSNSVGFSLSTSSFAYLTGTVYGGYGVGLASNNTSTNYGISSIGNLTVYGNCISLSSSSIIANVGNLTIYGNVSALSAAGLTLGGSVSASVYGNITSGTIATTHYGINTSSTGTLAISGSIIPRGAIGVNATASGSTASISVTGNIYGGNTSTASIYGLNRTTGISPITIIGNIIGASGASSASYGVNWSNGGNLTVYGNISGNRATGLYINNGNTSTVHVISGGNVYGGVATNATGITVGGSYNTITIYNNISSGSTTNTYGISLGGVITSTVYFYGNITPRNTNAIYNSSVGIVNVSPFNSSLSGSTIAAVASINNASNTGTLNISANVFGSLLGNGVNNSNPATINLYGNAIGGSGNNLYGVNNSGLGTVNLYGNITGGSGTNSYGVNNNNSTVNLYGNLLYTSTSNEVSISNGFVSVLGDLSANNNNAPFITNANVNVYGNVYSGINNTAQPLIQGGGIVNVIKNVIGNSTLGNNTAINATTISVSGNVYPGYSGPSSSGFINGYSTLNVYGDVVGSTNPSSSNELLYPGVNSNITNIFGSIYIGNAPLIKPNNISYISANNIFGYNKSFLINNTYNNLFSVSARQINASESGFFPVNSKFTLTPIVSSSILNFYKGGYPKYSIQGSNTNSVSSLPGITNITSISNTQKTITFNSVHNVTSTAGIISSTGFSDSTWNNIYGIVSIPSTTQLTVSGNFATTPGSYGTSILINQTGYYGNSALVLTNGAHLLKNNDTVYSYTFYDPAFSWNGVFNTISLSPSAFYIIGPSSPPAQYGVIISTKYFSSFKTPSYAQQTANIIPVPVSQVRNAYSYNSNTQIGNVIIPSLSDVGSDTLVDNGQGINVYGTMKKVPTSSVRLNTVYSSLTGSMIIPDKKFVSYGVKVDNSDIGIALLDATTLWNYPTSSINVNTIGGKIKNIVSKSDIVSLL